MLRNNFKLQIYGELFTCIVIYKSEIRMTTR